MSSDASQLLTSLDYISDGRLKVIDCTGHLCRLKLIGPFAHQVLADILRPPEDAPITGDWPLWQRLGDYEKAGLLPTGCTVGLFCDKFMKNR